MSHVERWMVNVQISEHDGRTRAEARLETGGKSQLVGIGTARKNPTDPNVPMIGDELATSRALSDLSHQLLHAVVEDLESASQQPAHLLR